MAGLRLTEEGLRAQLRVIREEIRTQVTGRPYGGFPWTVLPGVLYTSYANGHNGYGDIEGLHDVTPEECAAFHETHYAPPGRSSPSAAVSTRRRPPSWCAVTSGRFRPARRPRPCPWRSRLRPARAPAPTRTVTPRCRRSRWATGCPIRPAYCPPTRPTWCCRRC